MNRSKPKPNGSKPAKPWQPLVRGCLLGLIVLVPGPVYADGPPVTAAPAGERSIVQVVRVNGSVTSPRAATLSAAVAGLVETLELDAGDRVAQGDVVLGLDAELAELAVQRAEAAAAETRVAAADARRRLEEAERLVSERSIARTQVESLRAEAEADAALVSAAEAELRQQRALLERHTVRAPFDGVISERLTELGEWVNPGDPLLGLVATGGLRFDFRVPQEHFPQIGTGTPVRVVLDALPDRPLDGTVQAAVPVKDPVARTFLLRVTAPDSSELPLTPGMSAHAAIHIDTGRRGVVVPRDALVRYPDGRTTVWEVEGQGANTTVHERRVVTGLEFEGQVEIRSGLAPGTRVVARGNEALQDGQAVSLR